MFFSQKNFNSKTMWSNQSNSFEIWSCPFKFIFAVFFCYYASTMASAIGRHPLLITRK